MVTLLVLGLALLLLFGIWADQMIFSPNKAVFGINKIVSTVFLFVLISMAFF